MSKTDKTNAGNLSAPALTESVASSPSTPVTTAEISALLHWFTDSLTKFQGCNRGLLLSEVGPDQEALLQGATAALRAHGIEPLELTGEIIYKQAEYIWDLALKNATFGRPVASKLEIDISGSDVLFVRNLEAPESARQLWYLYHYVIYPRAVAGKPTVIATPLTCDELILYGAGCEDLEYVGRKISWEKLLWVLKATAIDVELYRQLSAANLPIMVPAEYALYKALRERNLAAVPQQPLGEYQLDIAIVEKDRKLDIECDLFHQIDTVSSQAVQAKKNLVLVSDGWKVLRFTISEILNNVGACCDAVEDVWQNGRKKHLFGRLISGQSSTTIPELPVDDDLQRLVITHSTGIAAVAGGAGTGKTSCAIHRVAFLISQGVNPERILVISHSLETIRLYKQELEKLVERQTAQKVNCYGWHDLGMKILKENLGIIKRKPPLKIETNPQKVIQRLLAKYKKDLDPLTLELSEELDEFAVAELISLYKANLVTPKYVKERSKGDIDELVAKVYQAYEEQLQKANKVDKDDQISLAAQILADYQEVRNRYQQYDHVIVDEYQDATAAGDLLVRLLGFPQESIFFVGDEDETICETKGGLPRLMAEMSIRLPNARCFVLEQNWRSHPAIIEHAKRLTEQFARRRIRKTMRSGWGSAPMDAVIGPQRLEDELAEAEWVADQVQQLLDSGRKPEDIGILYRYNRFALIIEEALSRKGIRCHASHPESGLVPDEVGDAMAYLRLVMDPDGPKARESFERICQLRENGVDPKLSQDIARFAEMNNLSYLKAIEIYSEASAKPTTLELEQLVRIIRTMSGDKLGPAECITLFRRSQRLGEYYKSVKVPPGINYEPLRALSELEEEARKYKTVSEFVKSHISSRQGDTEAASSAVNVLTIHESKGREFPVVFLVCMAEGLFPSDASNDREEERRLCYVGMTRARELLYLSFPERFSNTPLQPSSFLFEAGFVVPPPLILPERKVEQKPSAPLPQPEEPPAQQLPPSVVMPPIPTTRPLPAAGQFAPPPSAPLPQATPLPREVAASASIPDIQSIVQQPQMESTVEAQQNFAAPQAQEVSDTSPNKAQIFSSGVPPAVTSGYLKSQTNASQPLMIQNDFGKPAEQQEFPLVPPGQAEGGSAGAAFAGGGAVEEATAPTLFPKKRAPGELTNAEKPLVKEPEPEVVSPLEPHLQPLPFEAAPQLPPPVRANGHSWSNVADVAAAQVAATHSADASIPAPAPTPDAGAQAPAVPAIWQPPAAANQSPPQVTTPFAYPGALPPHQQAAAQFTSGMQDPYQSYPQASQGMPNYNCSSCGAPQEAGSRFCGECGSMTAAAQAHLTLRSCHLCGAPMDGDAKFCGECGSKQPDALPALHHMPLPGGPPPHSGMANTAPTQRGWVVKLLKFLED